MGGRDAVRAILRATVVRLRLPLLQLHLKKRNSSVCIIDIIDLCVGFTTLRDCVYQFFTYGRLGSDHAAVRDLRVQIVA